MALQPTLKELKQNIKKLEKKAGKFRQLNGALAESDMKYRPLQD